MAPKLYLLCGLPGSGKTTLAKELEANGKGIRLTADDWVWHLYPDDAEAAARDQRKGLVEELQWVLPNVCSSEAPASSWTGVFGQGLNERNAPGAPTS